MSTFPVDKIDPHGREVVAHGETTAHILAGMDRQLAEQWNARHPLGTRVSVILRSGGTITAPTATHAQQWGELALLTPVGVEGIWTTSALIAA